MKLGGNFALILGSLILSLNVKMASMRPRLGGAIFEPHILSRFDPTPYGQDLTKAWDAYKVMCILTLKIQIKYKFRLTLETFIST